jgi:hypothetical protein
MDWLWHVDNLPPLWYHIFTQRGKGEMSVLLAFLSFLVPLCSPPHNPSVVHRSRMSVELEPTQNPTKGADISVTLSFDLTITFR